MRVIANGLLWGGFWSLLYIFPHELLDAICFKDDVYLYTDLKHGMVFVVGPETMSKGRFIMISLLPNLVFWFIPYIISLLVPTLPGLGVFGALSMVVGAGARTYLYQFNL